MALAPVAFTLWNRALRYDVESATWANRDRFVLSAGHASMLLYSLLHLARLKDGDGSRLAIARPHQRFRQLGSRCAGHPERELDSAIEVTTGPLGTGIATSVGMAIAGKWKAERFNRRGQAVRLRRCTIAGDGDLMEGIGQEAAALAGHLQLDNLCWIYDSNQVTIEGDTDLAFTEDVAARFRAYGWIVDSWRTPTTAIPARPRAAAVRANTRPTLVVVHTYW